jgi:hypothetical protein
LHHGPCAKAKVGSISSKEPSNGGSKRHATNTLHCAPCTIQIQTQDARPTPTGGLVWVWFSIFNMQHAICNMQHSTFTLQHAATIYDLPACRSVGNLPFCGTPVFTRKARKHVLQRWSDFQGPDVCAAGSGARRGLRYHTVCSIIM